MNEKELPSPNPKLVENKQEINFTKDNDRFLSTGQSPDHVCAT